MKLPSLNREPMIPTILGDKYQIVFDKDGPTEVRDYCYPCFAANGSPEQLEAIRNCYNENVVNVIGPVKEGSQEAALLEQESFHSSWYGTGENKRKYFKNELANRKIYSQNGDCIVGASLMVTVDVNGKRGVILVNDPSKGPAGIGTPAGNTGSSTDPFESIEKTMSQIHKISLEGACKKGFEETGLQVDPKDLKHVFTYINNPMRKEIVGELDNHPFTSNAPSNVVLVWRAHYADEKALEMLESIGISQEKFNRAFEGDGRIVFKKHKNTDNCNLAEYKEISHHMLVPEPMLKEATHRIEKFGIDIRLHPLAFVQTALGIPRQAEWNHLPLVVDATGHVLHEKTFTANDGLKGAWLTNLEKIKNVFCYHSIVV